jgi:hypothetical protein
MSLLAWGSDAPHGHPVKRSENNWMKSAKSPRSLSDQ